MIMAVDFAAGAASLGAASLGAAALAHLRRPIFPRPYIRGINTFGVYFTCIFGTNGKTTFADWS